MKPKSRFSSILLIALALPLLGGCAAAVVGAGAGAVMIAVDRRAAETYVTDEGIELRAASRIAEKTGDQAHVNVTSYNRMLLLTGEVPTAAIRDAAEVGARQVPNVKAIVNELVVAPSSSLTARSNDAYITSKVKARFLDYRRFSAQHVKVVTEAGVVFLMGLVTQQEANDAVEIARTTAGVQKVIRLFEIITPEQARLADGKSAMPATTP